MLVLGHPTTPLRVSLKPSMERMELRSPVRSRDWRAGAKQAVNCEAISGMVVLEAATNGAKEGYSLNMKLCVGM
jgi:hypothetical protein